MDPNRSWEAAGNTPNQRPNTSSEATWIQGTEIIWNHSLRRHQIIKNVRCLKIHHISFSFDDFWALNPTWDARICQLAMFDNVLSPDATWDDWDDEHLFLRAGSCGSALFCKQIVTNIYVWWNHFMFNQSVFRDSNISMTKSCDTTTVLCRV